MYPQLFEIVQAGESIITISSYRFFGLVGLFYIAIVAYLCLKRHRVNIQQAVLITLLLGISFLFGARLLYALLYLPQNTADPSLIFKIHLGNFALFGGFALALPAWWFIANFYNLPFYRITDQLAPHTGIAAAILRVGCFLTGCCYGKITSMPWGISFPILSPVHRAQLHSGGLSAILPPRPVHPTQLYEMAAALLASVLAWYALRKKLPDGYAAAIFGFTFALGRLIVFFFRAFPVAENYSNLVRGPVVYGLAMAIFAAWLFKARKRSEIQT
mgnify:CR=1 FL=1